MGSVKGRTRIYQRGDWWHIYYRHNGRTAQESLGTRNKGEAELMQRRVEATLLGDRLKVKPRISTREFLDRFMFWLKTNNRRPKTLIQYQWSLPKFFAVAFHEYIDEFTPEDAERFKAAAQRDGLKPVSVNSVLTDIRAFLGRAVAEGFIDRNPFRRVPMLKVERKVPVFLTAEQVKILLDYLGDYPPYDLVACLGALCGFRWGEIAAALWEWFDWERQTVTLSSRPGFQLKDWEARTVPLSPAALSILKPRRKSRGYVVKFPGLKRTGPACSIKRSWPKLVTAAGLSGVAVKQLRSTFGSLYLQRGVSLSKIALWLGHSSEDVTRRHYATLMAYDEDIKRFRL